jgi:hypothetical protein
MSDEALLIGGDKTAAEAEAFKSRSAIATPTEIKELSVFGVFPDDTAIEQKFKMNSPRGIPDDQIVLFVWDQISKLGGLTSVGSAGEYNFFPLSQFKRLTLKFGLVVGVTLA